MSEFHYDIVIIGAGSSGIAAAVAASKKNTSVLLIEKSNRIGGLATQSEVGTICGLYFNDSSSSFNYNVDTFTQEFSESLRKKSNSTPILNKEGLKFLPYKINVFESICQELIQENKIDLWLNTELQNVSIEQNRLKSLSITRNLDLIQIYPKFVIDASGVNIVTKLSGSKIFTVSYRQQFSHIFTIENIQFKSEENLGMILLLRTRNKYDVSIVPGSYSEKKVSLKFNFSQLSKSITDEISDLFLYLKNTIDGFSNAEIKSIADETGCRIGERAEGEYVLKQDDVLSCRKFDNSIANGNWPIEIWKANKHVEIIPLKKNDFFQIPKTCLISKSIKNLFFAGRNISADETAIASARVIGTCLQTGFSAGKMALEKFESKLN